MTAGHQRVHAIVKKKGECPYGTPWYEQKQQPINSMKTKQMKLECRRDQTGQTTAALTHRSPMYPQVRAGTVLRNHQLRFRQHLIAVFCSCRVLVTQRIQVREVEGVQQPAKAEHNLLLFGGAPLAAAGLGTDAIGDSQPSRIRALATTPPSCTRLPWYTVTRAVCNKKTNVVAMQYNRKLEGKTCQVLDSHQTNSGWWSPHKKLESRQYCLTLNQ